MIENVTWGLNRLLLLVIVFFFTILTVFARTAVTAVCSIAEAFVKAELDWLAEVTPTFIEIWAFATLGKFRYFRCLESWIVSLIFVVGRSKTDYHHSCWIVCSNRCIIRSSSYFRTAYTFTHFWRFDLYFWLVCTQWEVTSLRGLVRSELIVTCNMTSSLSIVWCAFNCPLQNILLLEKWVTPSRSTGLTVHVLNRILKRMVWCHC